MLQKFFKEHWIAQYKSGWFAGDITAGITVAVMLIPQGMAYAMLAGLPPIYGLYASILPLFIYGLIGSSRELAVGPAAMVALLISAGVSQIAEPFSTEFVNIAILLALMVGVIQLVMGMVKLGFLTNFISHPVVSGFTSAAAVIILISQIKHIFGLSLPRTEDLFESLHLLSANVANTNGYSLVVGLGSLFLLWFSKKIHPLIPGPLLVVVISTLLVWWFQLDQKGVAIVGDIPKGLPSLSTPTIDWLLIKELLPFALTISLVGFMESYAVAQKFAVQKNYDLKPNQDLVGLGLANIVGAFFKIMPVTGGFGRTAANNNAGANTQLAAMITATLIALTLLFFTPLFYFLPKASLAAVIIMAVATLIDIKEIKHLWIVKKEDFYLLMLTIAGTWFIGIKEGILLGIVGSTLWFMYKTTKPHCAMLGKLPDRLDYRNVERFPSAVMPEHVLVVRFDAQFYYGNVTYLKNKLKDFIENSHDEIHAVVFEAYSINQLDSSAATALENLKSQLKHKGIDVYFSGVKGPVLDVMHLCGLYEDQYFYYNTHEAVLAAQEKMNGGK